MAMFLILAVLLRDTYSTLELSARHVNTGGTGNY